MSRCAALTAVAMRGDPRAIHPIRLPLSNFLCPGQVRKTALREVRLLRSLRHANVVSLLEEFRQGGKLYLVFEYVERRVGGRHAEGWWTY